MKKNTPFLNYLLSIGFILLIVIFLSSIVFISRYVLSSAAEPIGLHVKETKNILNDIKEVESLTKIENSTNLRLNSDKFLKLDYENFNISKPYIINLNENQSIFTFYINGEIFKYKNIYYKKLKSVNELEKRTIVLYNENKTGQILDIKNNKINILNQNNNKVESIIFSSINGIIFLKN